jgi:hypothetical protein
MKNKKDVVEEIQKISDLVKFLDWLKNQRVQVVTTVIDNKETKAYQSNSIGGKIFSEEEIVITYLKGANLIG